jgi:stearoyl-CoA desaturase (delta-9 desaturase)
VTVTAASTTASTFQPERKSVLDQVMLVVFIVIPLLAVLAAVPVAWGGWLSWTDVTLTAVCYVIPAAGITIGYHRYFTHGSFKANRTLKVALAVAGSAAIEGPVVRWVADHRKHHAYSDKEGDPHSPWRYGDSTWGLTKGFWYAHMGWLFDWEQTNRRKYAPDLIADADITAVSRWFPAIAVTSLAVPAILGGLITWSWAGALTAFFWASLVRVFLVHHITWSINSVCHVTGKRPFDSRDESGNVWWLAVPSLGESWHNLHHADPTCARHGVFKGQIDPSAWAIKQAERVGWAWDVRWPKRSRLIAKLTNPDPALIARLRD